MSETEKAPTTRSLAPGQRTEVWVADATTGAAHVVLITDTLLLEAPNWTSDERLLLNGDGGLWALPVAAGGRQAGGPLQRVPFTGLPDINNDHVLHPDGERILMSAADGHVYAGSRLGGAVERVTPDDGTWHFLHGVSPDGEEIAYVEIPLDDLTRPGAVVQLTVSSGRTRRLDAGGRHCDGPEYSPDGRWVYLNTEAFTSTPGHAQLARYPVGGGALERLATSPTVDWFPHLAPVGSLASYVAFPPGTLGHPADVDVQVVVVDTGEWNRPLRVFDVPGGQGTLNVNSWSPDGLRFAFVSYPTAATTTAP